MTKKERKKVYDLLRKVPLEDLKVLHRLVSWAKEEKEKMFTKTVYINDPVNCFVSEQNSEIYVQEQLAALQSEEQDKKGNKKMYDYYDPPVTREQRSQDYLIERLHDISWAKEQDLRKTFGLKDDGQPKTVKELAERLRSGRFVIDLEGSERIETTPVFHGDPLYKYIIWRDPAIKRDEKGFEEANKKLKEARQRVLDTIMIGSNEDGLKAVKEFEQQTFH